MVTLGNVYELIESAEQETLRGDLNNAITYYKECLKYLNIILSEIRESKSSEDVIEAIEILRKDVSQTIYDIQNIIDSQQEPLLDHENETNNELDKHNNKDTNNIDSTVDIENGNNINFMGSMYLQMKPSINNMVGTKIWGSNMNIDRGNIVNDSVLGTILNKLQHNLIGSVRRGTTMQSESKSNQPLEEEINQHIEQFKKELGWYEQKKFNDYDKTITDLEIINKRLLNQAEKLRERWDSLVESAKQRRQK